MQLFEYLLQLLGDWKARWAAFSRMERPLFAIVQKITAVRKTPGWFSIWTSSTWAYQFLLTPLSLLPVSYQVKDYAHPDDFYYDYRDDFWDYEDAEDYREKHH